LQQLLTYYKSLWTISMWLNLSLNNWQRECTAGQIVFHFFYTSRKMCFKTLQSNDKENYSTSDNLTKRLNIHERSQFYYEAGILVLAQNAKIVSYIMARRVTFWWDDDDDDDDNDIRFPLDKHI
jgi:hypothetical protein